jgi:hypothetical protein
MGMPVEDIPMTGIMPPRYAVPASLAVQGSHPGCPLGGKNIHWMFF